MTAPAHPSTQELPKAAGRQLDYLQLGLIGAVALGVLVRASHVLSSGFPLNDGGLFFQMARDLQSAGYSLPHSTTYNGLNIPYSYPPLGFYLAALLDDVTPFSLVDAFRFLPLVATCLTLPAFALLAGSFLPRAATVAAVLAFALVPRSFIWLLMGGGVTRSLGLLFALLALYATLRLLRDRDARYFLPAVALSSLTILSHLETGWFLAFSIGLFAAAYVRDRQGLANAGALALGTLALTSPWWLTVMSYHGLSPFLAAQETGGSIFGDAATREAALRGLAFLVATSEPLFPLLGALGIIGACISLASGRSLLVVWLVVIVLLDVRAYPTFTMVPLAMLAGLGLALGVLPLVEKAAAETRGAGSWAAARLLNGRMAAGSLAVIAFISVYALAGALLRAPGFGGELRFLSSLSREERSAMEWVRQQTPPDSSFLIIPEGGWETARASEWFPVLSGRRSVATVQGSEWLPNGAFEDQVEAHELAYECGYRTTQCLDEFSLRTGLGFSHVYIARHDGGQCCWTLSQSLAADPRYVLIYDGPGAEIYVLREATREPVLQAPDATTN